MTSARFWFCLSCGWAAASAQSGFRPPAVPLVTHDPYFSVWSTADRLTDEPTKHWTGAVQSMVALARIDGRPFRVAGTLGRGQVAPLPQTGLEVWPTRTIYRFAGQGIALSVTFLTPALPADLEVLARPASYIVWDVRATDGRRHDVSLYLDASKELAVNTPQQRVIWGRYRLGEVTVLRMGSRRQAILETAGDDVRIDWGHLYMAAPAAAGVAEAAAGRETAVRSFAQSGRVPEADDLEADPGEEDRTPVLAYSASLGEVGPLLKFSLANISGAPSNPAASLCAATVCRWASAHSRAYSSPPATRKSAMRSSSNRRHRAASASNSRRAASSISPAPAPFRRQ